MRRQHQRSSLGQLAPAAPACRPEYSARPHRSPPESSSPPAVPCTNFAVSGALPKPRPDRQHRLARHQRRQPLRRKILRRDASRRGRLQRPGHQLRRNCGHQPPAPAREPPPSPAPLRPATPPAPPSPARPPCRRRCQSFRPPPAHAQSCPCWPLPRAASAPAPSPNRPSRTPSSETIASSGEPIGATTTGWSQRRVNCPKTCAGLGAVKVITASAGKPAAPPLRAVCIRRPARRQDPQPEPAHGCPSPTPAPPAPAPSAAA